MSASFLPENYTVPKSEGAGNFMKLESGVNEIRIVIPPLLGYLYWNDEEKPKPVRLKNAPKITPWNIRKTPNKWGKEETIKHFWALLVLSGNDLKILEITQATIQNAIVELHQNRRWGDPSGYPIEINKIGEGMETKYPVTPIPDKTPLDKSILDKAKNIHLQALYAGGNPFSEKWESEGCNNLLDFIASYHQFHELDLPVGLGVDWGFDKLLDYREGLLQGTIKSLGELPTNKKNTDKKTDTASIPF